MANGDAITTKFKVDISDLKRGITEANKQIKLANAKFKEASSGMQNWSKSADGIRAKLNQLQSVLGSQKSKLTNYQKELERINEASRENGRRADELKEKLRQLADQGVSETSEEYKKYKKALNDVEKEQAANKSAADALKVTILNQKAAVNKTTSEIDKWSNELEDVEEAQRDAESATGKLTKEIEDQQKELEKLKRKYKDVVLAEGENSNSARDLAGQIDHLSGDLRENQNRLRDVDNAADDLDRSLEEVERSAEHAGDGFTVMKGALANLVADGIRKAIDALKEFAVECVTVGASFDSAMSQVGAVSGANAKELESLRDKAKEMGSTTKFSATEAADAFNYMAMAGWKTEDMLDGIDGILNLAAASGADLATTSDIVTDALTAMGYSAGDAGHLADVMAAASSNANTNVEMMGSTFQYAAPLVGALGYNMEDTAVAIGLMANAGIKGEKAGTALRSIFTRLAAPPKAAATAMEELGLSLTDSSGKMKPFNVVMEDMRKAFANLDETEQTEMASKLAGQEAMSGLLAIVNAAPEDFAKLTKAVDESAGSASKMSKQMMDNVGGDFVSLKSQFEGIQIQVYEKLAPALRDAMSEISGALKNVDWDAFGETARKAIEKIIEVFKWIVANKDGIMAAISGIATAFAVIKIGSLVVGFTKLVGAVQAAGGVMSFLAPALAAIGGPITIAIAVIAGLVAAFVLLWKKSDAFRNFWIGLWDSIKSVMSSVGTALSTFFTQTVPQLFDKFISFFTTTIPNAFNSFITFFSGLPEKISEKLTAIISKIVEFATSLKESFVTGVKNAINAVVTFFTELPEKIAFVLGFVIGKIARFGVDIYDWATTEIPKFIDSVITFFKELPSKIWNTLVSAYNKVKDWGSNTLDYITTEVPKIIESVVNYFKELPSKIWNHLVSAYNKAKEWGSNLYNYLKDKVSNTIDTVVNYFKELPSKIKAKLDETINKVKAFATDLMNKGKEAATKFKTSVVDGIKSIPSSVASLGGDIVSGLWNGISGKVSWLVGKVKGFAGTVIEGFKKGFDSHSPSRRMRDEVGVYVSEGLAVGIDKGAKSVTKSVTSLAKKSISAAKSSFAKSGFDKVSKNVVSSANDSIGKFVKNSTDSVKSLVNGSLETYNKSMDKKIALINKSITKQTNAINANKKLGAAQRKSAIAKIKDAGKIEIAELKKNKDNYAKAGKASITAYTDALKNYATDAKAAVASAMQGVNDAFTEKYNALVSSQQTLNDKMSDIGTLFTSNDNGTMTINNLKKQTNQITKYANDLRKIKGKVGAGLFDEIADMGVEDAEKYMEKLFAMSDKELKSYDALYAQKVKASKSLSETVYGNDLTGLTKQYNTAVDTALGGLSKKLTTIGSDAMKGFITGMNSQKKDMTKDIKKIADDIVTQFKKTLKIKSPSRVLASEVGKFIPSGIGLGVEENAKTLVRSIKRVTSQAVEMSQQMLSGINGSKLALAGASGGTTTNVVNNFNQTINAPKQPSRIELYRQTKNLLSLKGGV